MTNKYNDMPFGYVLDNINDLDILADTTDVIRRMYENKECIDYIYIPVDCVRDMDYVIAAINHIIVTFGYIAYWDCLNYVEVAGKYCIHLYLEEIEL